MSSPASAIESIEKLRARDDAPKIFMAIDPSGGSTPPPSAAMAILCHPSHDDISVIDAHVCISGQHEARNLRMLYDKQITHVANVSSIDATDVIKRNYATARIQYRFWSMGDHPKQPIKDILQELHAWLLEVKLLGGVALVHCQQGISRSVTMVVGHLMMLHKEPYLQVFEKRVLPKRPIAQPNPGFVEQLEAMEKEARLEDIDKFAKWYAGQAKAPSWKPQPVPWDAWDETIPWEEYMRTLTYERSPEQHKFHDAFAQVCMPTISSEPLVTPRRLVRSPERDELAKEKQS